MCPSYVAENNSGDLHSTAVVLAVHLSVWVFLRTRAIVLIDQNRILNIHQRQISVENISTLATTTLPCFDARHVARAIVDVVSDSDV